MHPVFCCCYDCSRRNVATQGLNMNANAMGQQRALSGTLGDPYEQRTAQSAGLYLTAPGPLPGASNHDDETDCDIPNCFVCSGEMAR